MPSARGRVWLVAVVALLLIHFYLRIHNPLALPAFVDERSHITRARIVYHLDRNPAQYSHGKLLYYYWLGLFRPGDYGGLAVSRLATALFSLVEGAASAAAARALFGRRAVIPALALVALAPFAVFYERMALADPFAGALAALAAWASIRLARQPTRASGAVVGLLIALAALAKLTTALITALPVIAVVLLSGEHRVFARWDAPRSWLRAQWQRGGPALVTAGAVCVLAWLPVSGAALWMQVGQGDEARLLDTNLVRVGQDASGLGDKLADVITTADRMLSVPMVIALAALAILLVWKRPARGGYALIWLALIWCPVVLLGRGIEPRYLVAGVPALAVLFGGGIAALGELFPRRLTGALALVCVGAWAVGFALPFAHGAATDPVALKLPDRDRYNYFSGLYNGWGISGALDYLDAHGERVNGRVPVAIVMRNCGVCEMHQTARFAGGCIDWHDFREDAIAGDATLWTPVFDGLERWPFVYAITEYLPPGEPPPGAALHWEMVYSFERPHGGTWLVTVWRVALAGGSAE
jgi:4-amino-4-deoxy-L-arabinose transferase-like glycosyltransferase